MRTFIFSLYPHEESFRQQAYEDVTNKKGEAEVRFIKCGLSPILTVSVLGGTEFSRTTVPEETTHLHVEVSALDSIGHTLVLRKALFPVDVKIEDIKMEVDLHKFVISEQAREVRSLRVDLWATHCSGNELLGEVVIPLSTAEDGKETKKLYELHAMYPMRNSQPVLNLEIGIKYHSVEFQIQEKEKNVQNYKKIIVVVIMKKN